VPETLEYHPLSNLFPLIEGAAFEELIADIRQHGVREAVMLYEGAILDGRNRHRAAREAGVSFPTRVYDGDDPLGFVISMNLKRRHAMVAAKLANMTDGGDRKSLQAANWPLEVTQEAAAALLNVGERSVRRAVEVHDHGTPELQHAVERGEVAVSAAADLTALPIEQ
jgi:hypothetical protein